MIGQSYKLSKSFPAALSPLSPRDASAPRPTWITSRNLGTERVDVASRLMAATATLSVRVEKPVYRFRVFFDPADPVDASLMERIADAILADLGADELQTMIGGFEGGAHPHLYVVLNRIHPDRGIAWRPSHDKFRIMASLRRLECEHGLREVAPPRRGRARGRAPTPSPEPA